MRSHVPSVAPSFQNRRSEPYWSSNVSVPDTSSPAGTVMVPSSNDEPTGGMPNDSRQSAPSVCGSVWLLTVTCAVSLSSARSTDVTVTS